MGGPRWEVLGGVPPERLAEARVLLHHAAQLVAAAGRSLVAPRPDDGHTSLEWDGQLRCLAGQDVRTGRRWRAALRPAEFSLLLLAEGRIMARRELAGSTEAEAFAWLRERATELGAPAERLTREAPYTIPELPVRAGGRLEVSDHAPLAELERWFANGDGLLRELATGWAGAAPVRIWPHHFDIGSVLPLGTGSGEDAASIGVGLSPGDDGIAEPYLYVTPWPPPTRLEALPDLPEGGRWHREGWTGALLHGSEIVAPGDGEVQSARARSFLAGAVSALRNRYERRGSAGESNGAKRRSEGT